MAKLLEIWIPNGLGGAFDDQLMKLPKAFEYERRDAVTYHRRTVESWIVYSFESTTTGETQQLMGAAEKVKDRYRKEVRYREVQFRVPIYTAKEPEKVTLPS